MTEQAHRPEATREGDAQPARKPFEQPTVQPIGGLSAVTLASGTL